MSQFHLKQVLNLQSQPIQLNLIGCDIIVNYPNFHCCDWVKTPFLSTRFVIHYSFIDLSPSFATLKSWEHSLRENSSKICWQGFSFIDSLPCSIKQMLGGMIHQDILLNSFLGHLYFIYLSWFETLFRLIEDNLVSIAWHSLYSSRSAISWSIQLT